MVNILQLTSQLNPADVVVAKKRNGLGRILNHYIVYVGNNTFIGNIGEGVRRLTDFEINSLQEKYQPTSIRKFEGDYFERKEAVKRAYSKLGQKYHLLDFNCEHFANYVQRGKESSSQVTIGVFTVFLLLGVGFYKMSSNGKRS